MKKNAEAGNEEIIYSVGEICTLTGVTRKTLFYYDRIGLLKPFDRVGVQSHKVYDQVSLERLNSILMYRCAGLQIREIREILENSTSKEQVLEGVLARLMRESEQITQQMRMIRDLLEEQGD